MIAYLSSTMPRKARRAFMAAFKSLTTKSQTNALLPPLFAPILLTECWAWMATLLVSSV